MISIIIVHYHVKKELFNCLRSIYDSKSKSSFEIIVVDNDEKKTIENDLKKQFPRVRYVKNDNKGFGQGNNVGATYAKGEYLFFLNPDTTLSKGTVEVLKKYLDSHKKTGIVAPMLVHTNGNIVPLQGARELTPLRAIFSFSFINKLFPKNPITKKYWYLDEWDKNSEQEVDSIPGTAFVIRRGIYDRIKGFDEKFFLYFEEHDLCKRVKALGWKIVMLPQAKVQHILGESTKQLKNGALIKIFNSSRLYYLKKHFGIIPAVVAEMVLRANKYSLSLLVLLLLGLSLRIINITHAMSFIGDQGWFYLSARDMLLSGNIPFVGIASSHPWLHQGAFWTYLLAGGLLTMNYNPFAGVIISIGIDLLAVAAIYKLGSLIVSQRTGIIAAALYATSPLLIANARVAYHTSPIPFFTILFLYFLYKWIQGNKYYFPLVIAALAVLYNFEIATSLLSVAVIALLLYGFIAKKAWAKSILNIKVLLLAATGWLIVMLPMLLYDFGHKFPQTIGFIMWIGYRILVFFGYTPLHPATPVSFGEVFQFFIGKSSELISLGGIIFVIISLIYCLANVKTFAVRSLLFITVLLLVGFFAIKTPSDAYLPVMLPGLVLICAIFISGFFDRKQFKAVGVLILLLVVILNISATYTISSQQNSFTKRLTVVRNIVKQAGKKEYTIKGQGAGSQFESFTMNYEYLAWWLGHAPSKEKQSLRFIINEKNGEIDVTKEVVNKK